MSVKPSKKLKRKGVYKAAVWIQIFKSKDSTEWGPYLAENILKDYNPELGWKGKLSIHPNFITAKSKSRTFSKTYEIDQVCGLLASTINRKLLVLGLLEETVTYMILRVDDLACKQKIINEISMIKGPDKIEMNESRRTIEEEYTSGIIRPASNLGEMDNFNYRDKAIPDLPDDRNNYHLREPEDFNSFQIEREIPVQSTQPCFDEEPDWDIDNSDGVMWVENTKYIEYDPSLKRNILTDDGSIYMYCAHQVVPANNGAYYTDSEYDSD